MLALLLGCGGAERENVPAQAEERKGTRSVDLSATDLFNWAERSHSSYFPSSQQNRFHDPYTYRFYPETGIYLGVAADRVYVMGGPFGPDPVDVGSVRDHLPVPLQRPAGTGNGCFDLDVKEKVGRRTVVESRVYSPAGTVIGSNTSDEEVLGQRGFNGQTLLATVMTDTGKSAAGTVLGSTRLVKYSQRDPGGGIAVHGEEGTIQDGFRNGDLRMVFSPPWVDSQPSLALGQSSTHRWTVEATASGKTARVAADQATRFAARESVTVPAGTFDTCRFDLSGSWLPAPMTLWIARGWGIAVQSSTSASGSVSTTKAWSVTVDGQPITGDAPP